MHPTAATVLKAEMRGLLRDRFMRIIACLVLVYALSSYHSFYGTYHDASPLTWPTPRSSSRLHVRESSSLTSTQPDDLTVLLQFGDQLIALLDDVGVPWSHHVSTTLIARSVSDLLLVLVSCTLSLNDALDTVDSARQALTCDEWCEVTVQPIDADTKTLCHTV